MLLKAVIDVMPLYGGGAELATILFSELFPPKTVFTTVDRGPVGILRTPEATAVVLVMVIQAVLISASSAGVLAPAVSQVNLT